MSGIVIAFVVLLSLWDSASAYPQRTNKALQANFEIRPGDGSAIFGHQNVLTAAPTKESPTNSSEIKLPEVGSNSSDPKVPSESVAVRNSSSILLGPSPTNSTVPKADMTRAPQIIFNLDPSRNNVESSEEGSFGDFEEYSYETDVEPEQEELRQKLCPGSGTGRQRLFFDQKAGKCAKVGEKAHCGDRMSFRIDPGSSDTNSSLTSVYGYCECDFGKSRTPLVYHADSNACYFVYQRAYCGPKEWLVFNGTGHENCEPKTCGSSTRRSSKLITPMEVRLNGTGPCVTLNQPSAHCADKEETVHFRPYELFPKCGVPGTAPAPRLISPVIQQRCPPGSVISFTGRCVGSWGW